MESVIGATPTNEGLLLIVLQSGRHFADGEVSIQDDPESNLKCEGDINLILLTKLKGETETHWLWELDDKITRDRHPSS